ncbi:MAG: polymerase sigma factor, sigma-70 family [Gemmatimonadetes bacterium]|nr:polymerase sigma factor, sigma-70 family [Gemmatimonadota bacterium]
MSQRTMLHILNGDATRIGLEQSGVPGEITVWGDVLYEGPVPRDVDDATFREARARFHAGEFISYDEALAMHERWDRGMARAATADEVVLWFEHDLHDQLLLVRQLDWFARQPARHYTLSLICIGEFPAVEPFFGLGQLTPDQLASLLDTRRRVSERQLSLGQAMWSAFTGDDPRAIERLLARDTSALPFLDGAMRRLLEDFPDARTGLPRTERSILEILRRDGDMRFIDLFPAQQQTEERVFMGDWTFWRRLRDLARGPLPLVTLENALHNGSMLQARVAITDDGRRALDGDLDWMDVAGIDRWIGGAHLLSPHVAWRWDGRGILRAPAPNGQD